MMTKKTIFTAAGCAFVALAIMAPIQSQARIEAGVQAGTGKPIYVITCEKGPNSGDQDVVDRRPEGGNSGYTLNGAAGLAERKCGAGNYSLAPRSSSTTISEGVTLDDIRNIEVDVVSSTPITPRSAKQAGESVRREAPRADRAN